MWTKPVFSLFLVSFYCTIISTSATDSPCSACPTDVPPFKPLDFQTVISLSPYFRQAEVSNDVTQAYVSQCVTYFSINSDTAMSFITTTTTSGSYFVDTYFTKPGPQGSGSFEIIGLTGNNLNGSVIYYEYLLATVCPDCSSELYVYQELVLAEDCAADGDYISPYILSSSTLDPDATCFNKGVKKLEKYSDNAPVNILSNTQVNCVVSFKGVSVVNSDKVLNDNRIIPIEF